MNVFKVHMMTETLATRLSELKFRRNANPSLQKAAASGDVAQFQGMLSKSLAKAAKRFQKQFSDAPLTSAWSEIVVADDHDRKACALMTAATSKQGSKKRKSATPDVTAVVTCITDAFAKRNGGPSAFLTVVAVELVLRYADQFSREQLVTVYCGLAELDIHHWTATPLPENHGVAEAISDVVGRAEIPLLLSFLLEPLQSVKSSGAAAVKQAASAIENVTDTDGTLQAALSRRAHDWLAPFVRIVGWASAFTADWASSRTVVRWTKAIERIVCLMTADGLVTQPLHSEFDLPENPSHDAMILAHAVRLADFSSSSEVSSLVTEFAAGNKKKKSKKESKKKLLAAARMSSQSDWAETALLRRGMTVESDVLSLDWDEAIPNLSLATLGRRILGGPWSHRIVINGKEHQSAGSWVCTCWFEDKEVAFAELEAGSEDGVRHVRHVMLSLKEHFALITESVSSADEDAEIDITSEVPLAVGTKVETNTITRELLLHSDSHTARVIPAWLEDDRVFHVSGACTTDDRHLVMSAQGKGGITLPLLIDWGPERAIYDADWNRLTVTEDRKPCTPHKAAGFRVRVGHLQVLLYRSLRRGDDLRAVLGLHTDNETVYSRIRKDGEFAPLVLVESEA